MAENDAVKSREEHWREAVLEALKEAEEVGERAGVGPAQALLAMLLVELGGLRVGLEEGIVLGIAGTLRPPEPPEPPEEKEPWQ